MNQTNLIELGVLEEKQRANPDSATIALQLLEFLSKHRLTERFLKLANSLINTFPTDLKIQFIIHNSASIISEEFINTEPDKEQSAILSDANKLSETTERVIPTLKPKDKTELRMKLLILKKFGQDEKAIPEIDDFEHKFGVCSQSVMMRADFYKSHNQTEKIAELKTMLETIEDEFKYSALAYIEIQSTPDTADSSDRALEYILKSIQLHPQNDFAYNVFSLYCKRFIPKPDLTRDILTETLLTDRPIELLSQLISYFIRFAIFFPGDEIFTKILKLAHPLDVPVIQILSALCLHFDNYGLARYISNSWADPNISFSSDFAIYLSKVAGELADKCKAGIGLKPIRKETLETLKEKLYKEMVEASIGSMKRFTETSPDNPDANLHMALLLQKFEMKSAKQFFSKAHKLDPANQITKLNLAHIYKKEGDNINAYEKLRDIIDDKMISPEITVDAMIQASEIAIKFGWIEEGEKYLAGAKSIMPFDARVTVKLAKIYLKEAKIIGSEFALDRAFEQLAVTVSKYPGNIEANYYLSHVHYMKREYLLAIRNFMKTTSVNNPFHVLSNFWISRSYYQLYKNLLFSSKEYLTSAIKFAETLTEISEKVPMVNDYLAHLYTEAGFEKKAEKLMSPGSNKSFDIDISKKCKNAGEVKVLSVYAPQMVSESDISRKPKRYFSIGSIGRIEVSYLPGNGEYEITGNLGDSFINSIKVAYKFFVRYLTKHGLQPRGDRIMHIDVPGWIPKYDGPSAGLPIAIAMISAYTGKPLPKNVTMTGEISSMGHVMSVGGIKEKIEATNERDVSAVFIPNENKWDHLDMLLKRAGHTEEEFVKIPNVFDVEFIDEVIKLVGIGVDSDENND